MATEDYTEIFFPNMLVRGIERFFRQRGRIF